MGSWLNQTRKQHRERIARIWEFYVKDILASNLPIKEKIRKLDETAKAIRQAYNQVRGE